MTDTNTGRRTFIKLLAGLGFLPVVGNAAILGQDKEKFEGSSLKLSLSQWSLHRAIFGGLKNSDYNKWKTLLETDPDQVWQGSLHPLNFPSRAKDLGFTAVDYVNTCFYGKARDQKFLSELRKRTEKLGVDNGVLMIDEEGMLCNLEEKERLQAVENHKKWLEAASALHCDSVRINLHGFGSAEEQMRAATDSLAALAEYADRQDIDLLVENHGGMSSHPEWLLKVLRRTDHNRVGTMVDFDNFGFSEDALWDTKKRFNRYKGVEMLMSRAKSVSAKAHRFDTSGEETCIDFERMMNIVNESGFEGYVSVEYEGEKLDEEQGIRRTRELLERYM